MAEKPSYHELEHRIQELEELLSDSTFNKTENITVNVSEQLTSTSSIDNTKLDLENLVDTQAIQSLMDDFYELTNIGIAILDLNGKILVAKGWQDICVKFHRVHPETSKNCMESDLNLSNGIEPGTFKLYQCKNNMLDMATPIIVGDQKVGNLYMGQFLFADESVNIEKFRLQAQKYGFEEDEYITALKQVPCWTRQTVNTVMSFYTKFANLLSDMGYKNFQLNQNVTVKDKLLHKLSKSEAKYRELVENLNDVIYSVSSDGRITYISPTIETILGYAAYELVGMNFSELIHKDDLAVVQDSFKNVLTGKLEPNEYRVQAKDGKYKWVRTSSRPAYKKDKAIGLQGTLTDVHERKEAMDKLHTVQKELKIILDASPALIWQKDTKGRYIEVNKKFCDTIGLIKENVVGKTDFDLFPKEIADEYTHDDQMVIAKGVSRYGITEHHINNTGEVGWSLTDKVIWYDNSGKATGTIGFAVDITARKSAEEELRQRESQYNAIVENSGDYIMRYDKNHRHLFANRRAIESTGLSREQYLGKNHREMAFPEDLCVLWEKNIDEVFSTGEIRKVDFDVELQDGWMSLELQLSPEFGKEGQVQSVIGVSRDVTERKLAQREDKLNKARLEILHTIRDINAPSEKTICDMALEKMVELSESEIGFLGFIVDNEQTMEIHAWSSSAMDKCAVHDKPMAFPIEQAGLWGEPVRNRKPIIYNDYNLPHPAKKGYPEGHVPVTRFMSVPVFDGDIIVAVAAVANKSNPYDKIDLKQLELMMGSVWDLIQRRRMEKEKEMLVSQLQKIQKMESIGNLAGGIAHDFNNILFPIVGMSEMLLEDLPPDSIEWENAQEIFTAGKRGSELVKQILAFSRQHENQLAPTRLQFIMKEVLKLVRSSIPANIEISQHLQQDCGLILADSTQLHQIGMNLITNAYHAVQDIDGKITVEVRELTINDGINDLKLPSGQYVTLKVEDNGIGIKKEHLDKIFEPYFTTKEQGKGTGLGLSVVYGIVKEHNGVIKVMSEPDKGTCFQIFLPAMTPLKDIEAVTEQINLETGNEHILLIDDELPILKLEKLILERLGYKVSERSSSPEALEAFKANPEVYDLVITDMSMPHMTGEQLAKELLKIRNDIPIIICTGFSERLNEEGAKDIGIKGFLMKPVVRSKMAQMVRKVLDEANG